jgi:hypothetical protein
MTRKPWLAGPLEQFWTSYLEDSTANEGRDAEEHAEARTITKKVS